MQLIYFCVKKKYQPGGKGAKKNLGYQRCVSFMNESSVKGERIGMLPPTVPFRCNMSKTKLVHIRIMHYSYESSVGMNQKVCTYSLLYIDNKESLLTMLLLGSLIQYTFRSNRSLLPKHVSGFSHNFLQFGLEWVFGR